MSPDDSSRIVTEKHAECTPLPDPSESDPRSQVVPEAHPIRGRLPSADPHAWMATSNPHDVEAERAPDSVHNLERAIVAATLAGRHATADLLADRLRERLARDRGNVVRLDDERERERKR